MFCFIFYLYGSCNSCVFWTVYNVWFFVVSSMLSLLHISFFLFSLQCLVHFIAYSVLLCLWAMLHDSKYGSV